MLLQINALLAFLMQQYLGNGGEVNEHADSLQPDKHLVPVGVILVDHGGDQQCEQAQSEEAVENQIHKVHLISDILRHVQQPVVPRSLVLRLPTPLFDYSHRLSLSPPFLQLLRSSNLN